MDKVSIEDVIGFTLLFEGDVSDHKDDPGKLTKQGITQKTYDSYRASIKQPARTVLLLTEHERTDIYTSMYWDPCMCSEMSYPLALVVFDTAVNTGCKQAIRMLQKVLGATVDGVIGIETMGLLRDQADQRLLAIDLIGMREQFYKDLIARKPSMKVFEKGWYNRTAALKKSI